MNGGLRIAIPSGSSAFEITTSDKGAVIATGGYDANFLGVLMRKLRLKYTLLVPEDGEWGSLKEGNWTGLIGMINRSEADMALGTLSISEDRLKVVDFSYPYKIKEVTFATKPPALLARDTAFIMPFSRDIWIGIVLLLILLPIVFLILFSKKYQFENCLMKVIGVLLRQSIVMDSEEISQTVIFAAWLFGASVLSMTYGSVLLSFLTVPLRETGIETKHQLAKAVVGGSVKCATIVGTSFTQRLLQSTDESSRVIGSYIKNNSWLIKADRKTISEFIYGGNTAVIVSRDLIKMRFHDNIFISRDPFFASQIAVAFSKSFPYKREVNTAIHEIAAAGIYEKDEEDYLFKQRLLIHKTEEYDEDSPKQLQLSDLKGSFLFLLLGLMMALIVYILEVLHNRLKQKRVFSRS